MFHRTHLFVVNNTLCVTPWLDYWVKSNKTHERHVSHFLFLFFKWCLNLSCTPSTHGSIHVANCSLNQAASGIVKDPPISPLTYHCLPLFMFLNFITMSSPLATGTIHMWQRYPIQNLVFFIIYCLLHIVLSCIVYRQKPYHRICPMPCLIWSWK